MLTYFYAHIPLPVYIILRTFYIALNTYMTHSYAFCIPLRPCTDARLHIYFYVHISPKYVYILLCLYTYYTCQHISTLITDTCLNSYAQKPIYVYTLLHPYTPYT